MKQPNVRDLVAIIRNHSRIAVVSHDNPDPDSIASAFGLHALVKNTTYTDADICFTGIVGKVGNREMLRISGIPVRWVEGPDLRDYDGVIFVDAQPGAGNSSLAGDRVPLAVIDHHPPLPQLRQVQYVDVRDDLGATTTIAAEYLFKAGVKIDARLATCMIYGIKSETLDLSRRTTEADIQAYIKLFPLVDFGLLGQIQNPKLPRIYFEHLRRAMERAYIYDGVVVISDVGRDARPEAVAEAADLLLHLEHVEWSICYGASEGEFFVSVRSGSQGGNAGALVQRVMDGLGSAGGHDCMAAARIRPVPRSDEGLRDLKDRLTHRFLAALGREGAGIEKLLEWKPRKQNHQAA